MIQKNNYKAYLYLLPAFLFLCVFMLYPLVDVFIYSFEENFLFVSQEYTGIGFYNYKYVLTDPYFLSAVKNTLLLVIITVPISTIIAILIAVGLNSIKPLKKLFETIFFLPYVTNTLAVGLVFMVIFDKTVYTNGIANIILGLFGVSPIDFIDGPYAAKLFVLSFYVIWNVMPFKIIVLVGALQSVKKEYYDAAKIDSASRFRMFRKITVPLISPMISYLVITGFIGAFKEYNNAVALFGTDLDSKGMNTIVGYVYNMLYSETGGSPSYASAAAIILFLIVLTITCINLLVSKKKVHY
ncbi:MAG: sugar ABC transporter permease [Anaeroplasma sp.]|nr:sugar ABC transporter permease [Anaeroplasma sp.]